MSCTTNITRDDQSLWYNTNFGLPTYEYPKDDLSRGSLSPAQQRWLQLYDKHIKEQTDPSIPRMPGRLNNTLPDDEGIERFLEALGVPTINERITEEREITITWMVIRHAEATHNPPGAPKNVFDTGLTDTGSTQATSISTKLDQAVETEWIRNPDFVLTSFLRRCPSTIAPILSKIKERQASGSTGKLGINTYVAYWQALRECSTPGRVSPTAAHLDPDRDLADYLILNAAGLLGYTDPWSTAPGEEYLWRDERSVKLLSAIVRFGGIYCHRTGKKEVTIWLSSHGALLKQLHRASMDTELDDPDCHFPNASTKGYQTLSRIRPNGSGGLEFDMGTVKRKTELDFQADDVEADSAGKAE